MPRKVFVAGEILTAADVNTNLMDQAVMVFDNSAARGSSIPSPSEGMVTYLKDTNVIEKYDGSAFVNIDTTGKILQVVSTTLTTAVSVSVATAGTFVDVSGLSATITPSSASSKIMVITQISHAARTSGTNVTSTRLVRGATAIAVGAAAGSRVPASSYQYINDGGLMQNPSVQVLDSPATTSAVTYKVQVSSNVSSQTVYVNRSQTDTDSSGFARTASTITLMEVAG
jgi:hypothetical protein